MINVGLVLFLVLLPVVALAQDLLISWEPYPPYEYEENGVVRGESTDLVNEVCSRLNLTPVYVNQPFVRALADIKTGDVDGVFCLIRQPEREEYLYYPSESIGEAVAGIVVREDSGNELQSLSDLHKYKVGVVRGYLYEKDFDSLHGLDKTIVGENEHLLKLLESKRVDAIVGDYNVLKFLHQKGGYDWKMEILKVTNRAPYYIAFSKKLGEKGRILAADFDRELKKIKAGR